jgi:RNA polymerase sigma-70 factor (ECF subfamily)
VLHDTFGISFEEIAGILGRTPTASRQLASRARRRVQGAAGGRDDRVREREVVDAFLAASRDGDFEALVAVLAPNVVLRADDTAVRTAAANKWTGTELPSEIRGARAVAEVFRGRAQGARRATIDGAAGAVWAPGGHTRSAFVFEVEGDRVVAIHLIMDPEPLAALDVELC